MQGQAREVLGVLCGGGRGLRGSRVENFIHKRLVTPPLMSFPLVLLLPVFSRCKWVLQLTAISISINGLSLLVFFMHTSHALCYPFLGGLGLLITFINGLSLLVFCFTHGCYLSAAF